jgi:quinol monooxygenase YgiN
MSDIVYIVKLTTAPGRRDEALAALGKLVDAAESEPGTLSYAMHTDAADADVIWFYEVYADQAAFEAHSGSPTMAEIGAALGGGLVAALPELHRVDVVRRKGEAG